MDNGSLNDTRNTLPTNISACCARMLGKSNLVMCHTEISFCRWLIPVGDEKLCLHPSNREIAQGILPAGWATSAPGICCPNIC